MTALTAYPFPSIVLDLAGPVAGLFERGLIRQGEAGLATLALWLLDRVQAGDMKPETADQVFTALDVYLTDLRRPLDLSPEAQELLLEGESLHAFDLPHGPDPKNLVELAAALLDREAKAHSA